MRFAAYAGTSVVLAGGVMVRALHQRANFYSTCVYLAQSSACLMILTNLALLGLCTALLGLQRLFYGPLRPIEVEQLYEKAWFAITETCLAMTIFRDEVGGWFLVMFVCLLIGKVWGWIGEGRVEVLEQQPPADPRLFHARLSFSLLISSLFNIFLLRYSVQTVLLQARPNMMVMFAFEFAVLTVTSMSTAARYIITLHEAAVIKKQINARRAQILQDRNQSRRAAAESTRAISNPTTHEDTNAGNEIDAVDIDVPGWEEKGRWVFYLDLATDFFKLVLYLTFFCVLCMFYGMPIHIIRDVAMTIRSFYKRINDFIRYRQATRDMNARYPDATPEEISREDVCIICREDMVPWRSPVEDTAQQTEAARNNNIGLSPMEERLRPKKLPCGHILHFACLRSWLERQQNCPTCRAPVLGTANAGSASNPNGVVQQARAQPHNHQPQRQNPVHEDAQRPFIRQNVFNLGPFRLVFGRQGFGQPINDPHPPNQQGPAPAAVGFENVDNTFGLFRRAPTANQPIAANSTPANIQLQLYQLEQQLMRNINDLQAQADQLFLVRALQGELARLRMLQGSPGASNRSLHPGTNQDQRLHQMPHGVHPFPATQILGFTQPQQRQDSGNQDLPDGLRLPDGWSILPLRRIPGGAAGPANLLQTSDINTQRSNDVISRSPSTSNSYGVHQLAESLTGTMGSGNRTPSHENANSVHSRSNGYTAITRPFGSDDIAEANSDAPVHHQHHADEERRAVSKNQKPPQIPLSQPTTATLASSPVGENHNPDVSVTQKALPQSSTDAQSQSKSADEGPNVAPENGQAKGKGKAATVEDYVEDVD
ncbi:E3 ubiquitin-protein ligase hrd1 [Pseudocyphellaria aurata]|nr:E3 ubiquitin-protein ligase hrd1 [Pseudocyphellaria aurata]